MLVFIQIIRVDSQIQRVHFDREHSLLLWFMNILEENNMKMLQISNPISYTLLSRIQYINHKCHEAGRYIFLFFFIVNASELCSVASSRVQCESFITLSWRVTFVVMYIVAVWRYFSCLEKVAGRLQKICCRWDGVRRFRVSTNYVIIYYVCT